MDYKSVVEEQIAVLQKMQENNMKRLEARQTISAEGVCLIAKTIEFLCGAACRCPDRKI